MGWARELHVVPDPTPVVLAPMPAAWECDLSDDSLRWTPGVFEIFGLSVDEPLRRDDAVAMYSPESRAELKRLRDEAIATCGSFTFEAEIRRPDGETRWMRVTADVEMRDGKAAYLYGLKQDITHLKRG
jgi:PAS domain S-box-containing protein